MKKERVIGGGMLLLAAIIWGCAFVAQSVAMDSIGPYTFGALRFALGSVVLLPIITLTVRFRRRAGVANTRRRRDLWIGGVVCGTALFLASSSQQFGLIYTTPGKSGFITAMYIVLVPILGLLVFRRRVSPLVVVGIAAAVGGLYLLCVQKGEGLSLSKGDLYTIVAAILFAVHILVVDHFADKTDGIQLSCLQFAVSAVLNGVVALITEPLVTWSMIEACWLPLLYTGLGSSGVAYTFQVLGQKRTPPTIASLLMSTESVFAVLADAVLLGQWLAPRELAGCCLMFAAVILAQIPMKKKT